MNQRDGSGGGVSAPAVQVHLSTAAGFSGSAVCVRLRWERGAQWDLGASGSSYKGLWTQRELFSSVGVQWGIASAAGWLATLREGLSGWPALCTAPHFTASGVSGSSGCIRCCAWCPKGAL
jgi:hypothetical protein